MIKLRPYEFWFVTGSQHLYGPETLEQVAKHSTEIAAALDEDVNIPFKVVFKPVLTNSSDIRKLCIEANSNENCAGIITWMHTFSPAKMWISGLTELRKPLLHLHTQYNRDIPWSNIDMDFMNLNQSAHGDREYGFIGARLRMPRKVVVGHWQDTEVVNRIGVWMRTAAAFTESSSIKVARFGDNMRDVAVTEGDKVEAEIKFGWSVNGYGIGDLVEYVDKVTEEEIDALMAEYAKLYDFAEDVKSGEKLEAVRYQAKIEVGLRKFLEEGNFSAFTTNFQTLTGLKQLPGLAVQHLMAEGYGFGPEGDWKTAALVRLMKIMADGKGTSIMEDYTYHFEPGNEMILGAHMLEVCPTLAATKPRIEVHPLGIGGKEDPARIVFNGGEGAAVCASLIDIGGRMRLIVNDVNAVKLEKDMPKLPVARVLWKPEPSLKEAAEAWIYAGGAHHTSFSYVVTAEQLADWAEITGIEFVHINKDTKLASLRNELRLNDIAWKLK
ncbi:L-arabinose isomerase [Clostridium sp. SYSU_GA19001]|uniref:L-arabinose isomerase n=1 Tax=Clostridium caldaquaticum TaxID=2940653 RepID=UPI002076F975|nr:L-arabinose isomerase [Clostridium caldaquaticum]MCM8709690.1 L-arabinose isomerase [Clostridium caldaquaticum]